MKGIDELSDEGNFGNAKGFDWGSQKKGSDGLYGDVISWSKTGV